MAQIEIEEFSNPAESDFKYVAFGHHDDAAFRDALRTYLVEHVGDKEADEQIECLSVRRIWVRPVRDDEQDRTMFEAAAQDQPDAIAITETDWV